MSQFTQARSTTDVVTTLGRAAEVRQRFLSIGVVRRVTSNGPKPSAA